MPAARVRKNGPRRLGRPPASESAETRERILSAARSCFAEFGYASTTNREIGERAGLTAGAIYHYFDSKVQLFAAVTEQVVTRIFDEFEEVIVSSPRLVERVRALLDVAVVLHRDDASLARFSTIYPVELLRHRSWPLRYPSTSGIVASRSSPAWPRKPSRTGSWHPMSLRLMWRTCSSP